MLPSWSTTLRSWIRSRTPSRQMRRGPLRRPPRATPRVTVEGRDVDECVALSVSGDSYSAFAELVQPWFRAAGRHPCRTPLLGAKNQCARPFSRVSVTAYPYPGSPATTCMPDACRRNYRVFARSHRPEINRHVYAGTAFCTTAPQQSKSGAGAKKSGTCVPDYRACRSFPRWLSRFRSKTSRRPSSVRSRS